MYDISEGTMTQINPPNTYPTTGLDIYEDKIVYIINSNPFSGSDGVYDLHLYDISTGSSVQITDDGLPKNNPVIYDNHVIWSQPKSSEVSLWDIVIYGILTESFTYLTIDSDKPIDLDVFENKIVFTKHERTIYTYDMTTGVMQQITEDQGYERYPAIFEDIIVWSSFRNDNWDIFMIDLSPVCTDGTLSGQCSGYMFCQNGEFVDYRCDACGCPNGQTCEKIGARYECTGAPIYPPIT